MCVCVCVCSLVILENALFHVSLFKPIAGKNVSPSDEQLWQFSENFLVAEKSQYKVLSIGCYLEFSFLLLMSAVNTKMLTFVSEALFLGLSLS